MDVQAGLRLRCSQTSVTQGPLIPVYNRHLYMITIAHLEPMAQVSYKKTTVTKMTYKKYLFIIVSPLLKGPAISDL